MQKRPGLCMDNPERGNIGGSLIESEIALPEQGLHARVKGGAFGLLQRFGAADLFARRLLRFHERLHVELQIGDLEKRQAVLPASQKIAGAAQGEVFLRNFEAVGRGAEGFETPAGLLIPVSGDEDAIRLRAAASDAAS